MIQINLYFLLGKQKDKYVVISVKKQLCIKSRLELHKKTVECLIEQVIVILNRSSAGYRLLEVYCLSSSSQ